MTIYYKRGFTLIELLVVIAIIGILSSIVLASLNSARQKGRDARRISDIKQLQLALELFYDANNQYATSTAVLVTGGYIAAIPRDPQTNAAYSYAALQGSAAAATTCGAYHLGATLEQGGHSALNGDADGVVGGTYNVANGDGTVCTTSPVTVDFAGTDPVYDAKP